MFKLSFIIIFNFFFTIGITAQSWNPESIEWYNDIRIKIADKSRDGLLQSNEIATHRPIFLFFLKNGNFKNFDIDNNNSLNQRELTYAFPQEEKFLEEFWQNQLEKFSDSFGNEQLKDVEYLKQNTGLLKQLVQNNLWLKEHDTIIETIFEDIEWVKKHPVITRTFSNNLRYFVSKSSKAVNWYKKIGGNEHVSDQFKVMRHFHVQYLSKNPKFKKVL